MSDLNNNKQEELPFLEFRHTAKVIKCAVDYQHHNANEIYVRIPKDTEGFTALTSFDTTLHNLPISDQPIDLLECWIDWPPYQPVNWAAIPLRKSREAYAEKLPMIIRDINVVSPEGVEVEVIPDMRNKATTIRAQSVSSSTIHIEFKVPNVFFSLPGREPFDHKRLTLNIKVPNGAASSVLHLEYPNSLSTRARADNSEYQSLVISIEEDSYYKDSYYRKATFYPQEEIKMRCTFGRSSSRELLSPGFPPLHAGLTFLGFGIALLLLQKSYELGSDSLLYFAQVIFAVSLIPTFLEMFRVRRLFSRSAMLPENASWDGRSRVLFGVLHTIAILLVAVQLFRYPDLDYSFSRHLVIAGAVLTAGTIIFYFLPVTLGTYQKYMCDRCEKWTWIRRWFSTPFRQKDPTKPERIRRLGQILHHIGWGVRLHPNTRHSLCADCYEEVSKEHLEYKLPKNTSSTSDDKCSSFARTADLNSEPVSIERAAWKTVLDTINVEVNPLPEFVNTQVRENLKNMGLGLRFIPSIELSTLEVLQRIFHRKRSVKPYLECLQNRYPGWETFESLVKVGQIYDCSVTRNLQEWYWELVANSKLNPPRLPGLWVAVETAEKSASEASEVSPLAKKFGFNDKFNVSWQEIQKTIEKEKLRILSELGLPEQVEIRLLEALEWNLLGNREGWGKTNTYEWTNTEFRTLSRRSPSYGYKRAVIIGKSDAGGAGCVRMRSHVNREKDLGFRIAIVLKTCTATTF